MNEVNKNKAKEVWLLLEAITVKEKNTNRAWRLLIRCAWPNPIWHKRKISTVYSESPIRFVRLSRETLPCACALDRFIYTQAQNAVWVHLGEYRSSPTYSRKCFLVIETRLRVEPIILKDLCHWTLSKLEWKEDFHPEGNY